VGLHQPNKNAQQRQKIPQNTFQNIKKWDTNGPRALRALRPQNFIKNTQKSVQKGQKIIFKNSKKIQKIQQQQNTNGPRALRALRPKNK
jgi:hypothetical protein